MNAIRFLLDTNTVSAWFARLDVNRRLQRHLERHRFQLAIGAPVWHELLFGCRRLPSGRKRDEIELYLQSVIRGHLPILPYDEAAASWHAEERARLVKLGKTPSYIDGQIAAIAASQNLTLVTANTRHFEVFEGLAVVDWTR